MNQLVSEASSLYRPSAKLLGRILLAPALLLGVAAMPAAADVDNGCSIASLKGDYAFTIDGWMPNPDGTQSPNRGVAITHFDGAGNLTQRDFVITAGIPNPSNGDAQSGFHFSTGETGTYDLHSDCTGSAVIDLNAVVPKPLSPGVIKLMLVVTHHGNRIHTVVSEITLPGTTAPSLNTTSSDAWKIGYDPGKE
jgi:hypothetical protein